MTDKTDKNPMNRQTDRQIERQKQRLTDKQKQKKGKKQRDRPIRQLSKNKP